MKSEASFSWFNIICAAGLIVIGCVVEPLLVILGVMIMACTLLSQVIEEYRNNKVLREMEENIVLYKPTAHSTSASVVGKIQ